MSFRHVQGVPLNVRVFGNIGPFQNGSNYGTSDKTYEIMTECTSATVHRQHSEDQQSGRRRFGNGSIRSRARAAADCLAEAARHTP